MKERFLNKKVVIITSSIVVGALLILAVLFMVGIKITFFLHDELNLKLTPLDVSVHTTEGSNATVMFTLVNNNFVQCTSACTIWLKDEDSNNTLYTQTLELGHGEKFTKNYSLQSPDRGSGQRIYLFEAACYNVRSILCQTDEVPRYKSATIWLNYNLTPENAVLKDLWKDRLDLLFYSYNKTWTSAQKSQLYLQRLPRGMLEKTSLLLEQKNLSKELGQVSQSIENHRSAWDDENYGYFTFLEISPDFSTLTRLDSDFSSVKNKTLSLILLRNSNIQLLRVFVNSSDDIAAMALAYETQRNVFNNDRLQRLSLVVSQLDKSLTTVTSSKTMSEALLHQQLQQQIATLDLLKDEFFNQTAEGIFNSLYSNALLSNFNMSVTQNSTCGSVKASLTLLESHNAQALIDRQIDLNSSLYNAELARFANTLSYNALVNISQSVSVSNSSYKDYILSRIASALQSKTPSYTYTLTDTQLLKYVIVDVESFEDYVQDSCKDPGTQQKTFFDSIMQHIPTTVSPIPFIDLLEPKIQYANDLSFDDNPPLCCVFGVCQVCCEGSCQEQKYPVLFIHGHTFNEQNTPEYTMSSFAKLQRRLSDDGYINAGELDIRLSPADVSPREWGRSGVPVATRASYYYISYFNLGSYTVSAQKSERVENYALRLQEIIELLKYRTGSPKVVIVAHSMGGLVAREYMALFGTSSVDKLITINSPHHGVAGNVQQWCDIFGALKECEDMREHSVFLQRLNAKPVPPQVYVIRSTGCSMDNGKTGDGIVTNESGYLEGAQNFLIQGQCTDRFQSDLHGNVLDPDKFPQLYDLVVQILSQ